jgi:hypothetical protein
VGRRPRRRARRGPGKRRACFRRLPSCWHPHHCDTVRGAASDGAMGLTSAARLFRVIVCHRQSLVPRLLGRRPGESLISSGSAPPCPTPASTPDAAYPKRLAMR